MRNQLRVATLVVGGTIALFTSTAGALALGPVTVVASSGQTLPDGGTLSLDPTQGESFNAAGQIAFFSYIDGVARNEGVFIADAQGLRSIVRGCGAGLGQGDTCAVGDPTPIGGRFSGIGGNSLRPSINVRGDVLFLADVVGGTASRALFLYRADTADIVKVIAIGDSMPGGGTLHIIGAGSLNDRGEVAFCADDFFGNAAIFSWRRGKLRTIVQVGDNAPGGGAFDGIHTGGVATLPDGTSIYLEAPDINNSGQVLFAADVVNGMANWGIFVTTPGGTPKWYIHDGDSAPSGGTITFPGFINGNLNDAGQIAWFFALSPGPSQVYLVGKPGAFRAALSTSDSIDGLPISNLLTASTPQQALDQDGNLAAVVTVVDATGQEHLRQVISADDGGVTVVAREGDPGALGGTITYFDQAPSLLAGRGTIGELNAGGPALYGIFEEGP